jgi:hypothetical protein
MLTRVNADGSRPGTFTPLLDVSGGVGFTRSLALAPDGLGGVFVLRNARPPGGPGVDLFVRHFTPFATVYPETEPWGTRVGAALGDADEVRVSPDGAGGVLAVWDDTRSGDADLYMTRLDAFGGTHPGWPDSGLAVCVAPGQQLKPRLASTDGGGWIVTWTDRRFGHDDVRAARLDRFGAPLPGWPSGGLEVAGGTGQQSAPDLAVLADGTALAAWVEDKPSGAAEVRAMRLSPDGHASPGPPGAPVVAAHVSAQADPVVVMRPDGRAWVLWRDLVEPNVADVLGTVLDVPLPLDTGPAPVRRSFALRGARPNPASTRAVRVVFTLPDAAPARLELFDAAGRRLAARDVGAFGAGAHAVTFEPDAPLAPGVVLVRLARGGDVRTARVGVVR